MKLLGLRTILVMVGVALWITGCAATPETKMSAEDRALCAALDHNADGKITKEEFMARTNDKNKGLEVFQKCDADKNEHLTYDEVWKNRMMLPPELLITTPPLVRPVR